MSTEATCIYVVTLKVLGVAGITAERLLCNDVTQSPSAPTPPEQMQAKIVICRNAVPCAESHLSSKLQRSSAKEDVSARIGGKQRFLAIWSDLQTGLGATFEVELPKNTSSQPKQSTATAAVPRVSRKDFELLIFLSDGTISAPIAAANLPVTAGKTEGIRDLPLYNIESDFTHLFENSTKSGSAMAAGVGEKMKALQTTYGIDSMDSVLRIQLTVETKAEVIQRQAQQKEAQREKEMARKLALSHAKPRNGYFRRHQTTDPEKKRSKRNKEASRKAFVHGEKHLRRKSAKSIGDSQTDGLAQSDSANSPSTPLSMTKKTLSGLISVQHAAHKDEKKEEMQSEAESFLTLDQNSEVASIIEKTTILVEKQRSKKTSSDSSSSEDATFDEEYGSEDDYDDEDSEYSLKMPAPLKKAIKMLDMIQLPGCVAADDLESATFDDSTQENQDDQTQASFRIPGCTVPEEGIRGIKWNYSPTTQFYERFGCWRSEPTDSLDTQDETSKTSMPVPAAQGNGLNVLDGTSKSKNGPITHEQPTAATQKKKGKLQTFTATTSKDPYIEVASLTGPGDGSSIFQDIETYSIVEHLELRIQRDRGEPEERDKPPRPSSSIKQATFRPAVTSRPPGKRKNSLEVADMTSRVISGVAIASSEKSPEIGQATATSSKDTHYKQSQSPHVVQIYSIVSREEEADRDAKKLSSSHDSHSTPASHRSDDSPNSSPAAVQDFPHPESTEDKSMVGSLPGMFRKPHENDAVRKQRKSHSQSPGQPGIVLFKEKSDDVDSVGELTLTSHEMRVEGMKVLKPGRSSWESPALFSNMFSCGPNKPEYFETVTRNASADAAPYDEASVASSVEMNDAVDAAWAKLKADKGEYQKPNKVAT